MSETVGLLIGLLLGFGMYHIARNDIPVTFKKDAQDEQTVMVKRSKPSLRSPLKTHQVHYEKYKSKDSGLYAPSVAKQSKDEVEIGR